MRKPSNAARKKAKFKKRRILAISRKDKAEQNWHCKIDVASKIYATKFAQIRKKAGEFARARLDYFTFLPFL